MRSFMAASTMTKRRSPESFTKSTRVRRTPAFPTMKRPGSIRRRSFAFRTRGARALPKSAAGRASPPL